jgi:transcriptional regulator with XRE-family HTH domain
MHRRRAILGLLGALSLGGCLGERSGTDTPADSTTTVTDTTSPTETTTPVPQTTLLRLGRQQFPTEYETDITPLVYADRPASQQEILDQAGTVEGYEVQYQRGNRYPDTEKTEGLAELVDAIFDRHQRQIADYEETHSDETVPDAVRAVWLARDDRRFCIELTDGDVQYYRC